MIQSAEKVVFGRFIEFVLFSELVLHIVMVLMFFSIWQGYQVIKDHSRIKKGSSEESKGTKNGL